MGLPGKLTPAGQQLVNAGLFKDLDAMLSTHISSDFTTSYGPSGTGLVSVEYTFRGRSAQNFRDPGSLGIMNPENDAVYLPLKRGRNELVLAVSELGGGWGFIARLAEPGR